VSASPRWQPDGFVRALESVLQDSPVRRDHDVGPLTTYSVGGSATVFVEVATSCDLAELSAVVAQHRPEVVVLGRGSNLLVADTGIDGFVLRLGEAFAGIDTDAADDVATVVLGGGVSLPAAARRVTAAGLAGFEWAVGVPGSAGGAVRMNAGGHGSDMAASVCSVRLVDLHLGAEASVTGADLGLGYRQSSVEAHQVVTSVTLALEPGESTAGEEQLREIVRWRREHQPGGQNAGSVFTNPPGDSAGRLIDAAGLRGHRVGTAHVSHKHANFIQAEPGGHAADIVALMALVVERVREHSGVTLHPETALVGFDPVALEPFAMDTPAASQFAVTDGAARLDEQETP